jgi:hypothetical protein
MSKKPKFKPIITRIKLNPEQAVLYCSCYTGGFYLRRFNTPTSFTSTGSGTGYCVETTKTRRRSDGTALGRACTFYLQEVNSSSES